jgi:spore coat polysaccharide biosynthesis predicted glycosyltransferase SpsG
VTIVFAFDEGPDAGMGHRRRCAAIAAELHELGSTTAIAPRVGVGPSVIDAPVIVVDSYRTRADDRARYRGVVVVAIDDLARDLDVALVIDPAPGAQRAPHRRAGQVLAGAPYAIVDPALRQLASPSPDTDARNVLVATGASDTLGHGPRIAREIAARYPQLRVRLVVGPWSDPSVPDGVDAVERLDGLAAEIAAADIVVSAGGVTLLESLCIGRPTIAIALNANQRGNVDGAVAAGAALLADPGHVVDALTRLVEDPALRCELSDAARSLIDGRGAARVADAIVAASLRAAA